MHKVCGMQHIGNKIYVYAFSLFNFSELVRRFCFFFQHPKYKFALVVDVLFFFPPKFVVSFSFFFLFDAEIQYVYERVSVYTPSIFQPIFFFCPYVIFCSFFMLYFDAFFFSFLCCISKINLENESRHSKVKRTKILYSVFILVFSFLLLRFSCLFFYFLLRFLVWFFDDELVSTHHRYFVAAHRKKNN